MIQNFKELDKKFDYPEWNQYGRYEEEINNTHDSSHTACSTPNPPWWCEDAVSVPIDDHVISLIIIAIIIVVIYLRSGGEIKS